MVDKQMILDGGGKSGAILRRLEWANTPLGRPSGWPEALRTSLRLIMSTHHPMLIWWGDQLLQFYNDGFAAIARQHVSAHGLGKPGAKYWRTVWNTIGPDVDRVMAGRGGVSRENQLVSSAPDQQSSNRYWTYSLSPIHDRRKVAGALFVCRDETIEVKAKALLKTKEAELVRIQQIGGIGGLEVKLTAGFQNRRSPEYLFLHGLPPNAAHETHENWVRRIHPEDRYRTENAFLEAVNGKSDGYSIQYRIIRPSDARVRWICAKTEIERDRSGRAIRLIGAHTDVTDHFDVRAIERDRFKAALDVLRCAVILTDANGGIVYANRCAQLMLTEGTAVRSRHNRITAVPLPANNRLRHALKSASASHERVSLPIKLSVTSPVVAHVLPLASTELGRRIEPAVAAIFIRDREDARGNATLLSTTYELTVAETRVLSHLLGGQTLPEIAEELGVATSTVRTHLDVIFRKAGVNRQSELLLLASQFSPPIALGGDRRRRC